MYFDSKSSIYLDSVSILGNTAYGGPGGAITMTSSIVYIQRSMISGNSAAIVSGASVPGVFVYSASTVTLVGCSLSAPVGTFDVFLRPTSGAIINVKSYCLGGSYSAGSGYLSCFGCTDVYPANLLDQSCSSCPALSSSCCGAMQCSHSAASCQKDSDGLCPPCERGTFLNSSFCLPCFPGQYASSKGVARCTLCPSGKFVASFGTSSSSGCTSCVPGTFSTLGSSACSNCQAGKFSFAGSSGCSSCPVGTFQESTGGSVCLACSSGHASVTLASVSCIDCPSGAYSSPGASGCSSCAPGYMQPASASPSCSSCPTGRYQTLSGSIVCLACELTYISPLLTYMSPSLFSYLCFPRRGWEGLLADRRDDKRCLRLVRSRQRQPRGLVRLFKLRGGALRVPRPF